MTYFQVSKLPFPKHCQDKKQRRQQANMVSKQLSLLKNFAFACNTARRTTAIKKPKDFFFSAYHDHNVRPLQFHFNRFTITIAGIKTQQTTPHKRILSQKSMGWDSKEPFRYRRLFGGVIFRCLLPWRIFLGSCSHREKYIPIYRQTHQHGDKHR